MEVDSSKPTHTAFDLNPISTPYSLYSDQQLPSLSQMGEVLFSTLNAGIQPPPSPTDAAAMKLQKIYRGYRTRRLLADSAVVAEELWWQALDFARLNHSTVSFFNFEKPESAASRWNRISLNASKVGKGLSLDSKAHKLAFQHWIEAIDPRHRYGHSLHIYYEEWCKADAGQPFFYWLDIGDGKEVDLKECPRSKLRQQCIKYLGPQEREHYEYIIVEGKIMHRQTQLLLDTKNGEKWIFVMCASKRLYAGEKKKGNFHHSSFLAGGATLAAGRLDVENGILKIWINSTCSDICISNSTCSVKHHLQFRFPGTLRLRSSVSDFMRIKEIVDNSPDESASVLCTSLRKLQLMSISVETLKATEIGKSVNVLRKHALKDVRELARSLIEVWKDMVDEWVNATAKITVSENTTESMNPSDVDEEEGLPSPPLDDLAFLNPHSMSLELSEKFFDGMDDYGNAQKNDKRNNRKPSVEKQDVTKWKPQKPLHKTTMVTKPSVVKPCKPPVVDSTPQRRMNPNMNQKLQNPDKPTLSKRPVTPQQRKAMSSDGETDQDKLEATKRRLQESYQQAEKAKRQRTIQVMELQDLPKQNVFPKYQQHARPGNNHHRQWANGQFTMIRQHIFMKVKKLAALQINAG